ncbi:carboxypeptidase-like regulatory domain-containing protein [Bremerella sp. P1]|uniref:carboxypeptidase-like regulatory domain-containing protein n=1 Tax=Bremerella sp. P1 TaxID=3026424 RepID=UPI002368A7C3|nr:carboxypeptidase-like regulatory domain-containing protein [Bremerella sp. P1]WDI41310.1 carboxypeptidase-like regulatory domain-containing protein [Bremerella sp. P1]
MIRFTLLLTFALCVGCSNSMPSNVADVSGMVTVDGKPAPGAMVSFSPTGEGRTSFGLTDDTGHYRLVYTNEVPGALIGDHDVSINNTPPPGKPKPSVLVPAKFTQTGKLSAKVVPGEVNEINFALKSK